MTGEQNEPAAMFGARHPMWKLEFEAGLQDARATCAAAHNGCSRLLTSDFGISQEASVGSTVCVGYIIQGGLLSAPSTCVHVGSTSRSANK